MTTVADVTSPEVLLPPPSSELVDLVIGGLVDDVRTLQHEVFILRAALGGRHAIVPGAVEGAGREPPRAW